MICTGLLLLAAGPAAAKGWKGALPGTTTRDEVIAEFGDPSREFSRGGKLSDGLNYQGDAAIEGSLEANFYFDKHGVLFRIDVFPARAITRSQIERIFGKNYVERVTKNGNSFLNYRDDGMVVFFEQEHDRVASFMFVTPSPPNRGKPGK